MFLPYRSESCVFGRHCRSRILNYADAELLPMQNHTRYLATISYLFSDNHQNSAAFSDRYTASSHYYGEQ